MNIDMTELIELCIHELNISVRPVYENSKECWTGNKGDEDPVQWLYFGSTERVIRQRMEEFKVEKDLFDDIYFAICWEVREKSLGL